MPTIAWQLVIPPVLVLAGSFSGVSFSGRMQQRFRPESGFGGGGGLLVILQAYARLSCFSHIRNITIQIPILTNRIISFDLPVMPSLIIGLKAMILTIR